MTWVINFPKSNSEYDHKLSKSVLQYFAILCNCSNNRYFNINIFIERKTQLKLNYQMDDSFTMAVSLLSAGSCTLDIQLVNKVVMFWKKIHYIEHNEI